MAAYPFFRILSAVILSAGIFGLAGCANHPIPHAAGTSGRQVLAFPSLHLAEGEYIQSVQIVVKEGRIASVNQLLDDWDIELVWDHPALLTLTYQARHFSTGLDDLHRLDGFIIVEATDDQRFSIAATVKTESTDNTGRGERTYSFSTPELVLKSLLAGAGCAATNPKPVRKIVQPNYRKWEQVKTGMAESEVDALLGKPLSRDDPDWYKKLLADAGLDSERPGAGINCYSAVYGLIQLDQGRGLVSPYEFMILYDCKDHRVVEKHEPFAGRLSADGKPTTPLLTHPAKDEQFDYYLRDTDFRWKPSSGEYPIRYEVQLRWTDEPGWDGDDIIKRETDIPYLCESWGGKNPGTWRVRATNRLGVSPWSEERKFNFNR